MFNIGDKIKCINTDSVNFGHNPAKFGELTVGKEYTVLEKSSNPKCTVIINDKDNKIAYYNSRFEKVKTEESEGIKPGDTVRCINNGYIRCADAAHDLSVGKEYKVLSTKPSGVLEVVTDKGNQREYFKERFEKVTITQQSFKTGDTVQCTNNGPMKGTGYSASEELTRGKNYTVVNYNCDGEIQVINDKNEEIWYLSGRFAKAKPITSIRLEPEKTYLTKCGYVVKLNKNLIDYKLSPGQTSTGKYSNQCLRSPLGWMWEKDGTIKGLDEEWTDKLQIVSEFPDGIPDLPDGYDWANGYPWAREMSPGEYYICPKITDPGVAAQAYENRHYVKHQVLGTKRFPVVRKSQPQPANRFKVGDEVKCVKKGEYGHITLGKTYKVIKISNQKEPCVHVINNGGYEFPYEEDLFEKAEPRLQTGDTVKCIDSGTSRFLTIDKTYKVLKSEMGDISVLNDANFTTYYPEKFFEKVPTDKFRVGQIVKCVKGSGYLMPGDMYKVISCRQVLGNNEVTVHAMDGKHAHVAFDSHFEDINMEQEIKVSDTIKCIDAGGYKTITNGNIYKVLRVSNDKNSIIIINDDGYEIWFPKKHFKVHKTDQEEIKVGNTVKCIGKVTNLTIGKEYKVIKVDCFNYADKRKALTIVNDKNNTCSYLSENFSKCETFTANKEEIKTGDTVECIDSGPYLFPTVGQKYVCGHVDPRNQISIGDGYALYPSKLFKKCDVSSSHSTVLSEKEIEMKKETALKVSGAVGRFVANWGFRALNYWVFEPATGIGRPIMKSVRYATFLGGLAACGYGYYHPDVVIDGIKSCLPKISIEAPEILSSKEEAKEA